MEKPWNVRFQLTRTSHKKYDTNEPLFDVSNKRTAEMLKKDLQRVREAWIEEAKGPDEQAERERSSFLCYVDENGHYADFHALRKTFITNLSKAGVSPKTAQTLARHSDINLTMNTYTMLGVYDQAAAVESLPPIPTGNQRRGCERCQTRSNPIT